MHLCVHMCVYVYMCVCICTCVCVCVCVVGGGKGERGAFIQVIFLSAVLGSPTFSLIMYQTNLYWMYMCIPV